MVKAEDIEKCKTPADAFELGTKIIMDVMVDWDVGKKGLLALEIVRSRLRSAQAISAITGKKTPE